MDHKAYLSRLKPDQRDALTARIDGPGVRHLALHGGLILLLGILIALRVPFWWLLLFPQGIAIVFLFTLQHEATHKTPFASEPLNEWVGWATGLLLIQPFIWFRYFHLAHHRYTNDPANDPELAGLPKPDDWRSMARHLSCVDYWWAKGATLWQNAFGSLNETYLPDRIKPRVRSEARKMWIVYAVIFVFTVTLSPVLLWVWFIPLMLGFPVLRLYLLAEHGRCPTVANMFDNTRTTYTNRFVRFLAWNMPFHAEHHVYPQVPFHRLPEFHADIKTHLRQSSEGYRAFARDYVADFTTREATGD